jgi:hypothetical protein
MTITGRPQEPERDCPFPPHPGSGDGPELVTDSAWSRFAGWVRHAPAERLPLPAIPAVWTAAEVLHLASLPGMYPGMASVAAAGVAYGAGERRARDPEHARMRGAEVAAITASVGAWLTAGTVWGPLAGPDHLLTIVYALGAGGGYWWARRHDALRAARARRDAAAEWRARKAAWHALAPRLGLQGSHLLSEETTLLGDTRLIDVRGTGRRASQLASRDLAERIGELEMIPVGRIDVTADKIPGRLRISVRRTEPWANALTHPVLDPASPYAKYAETPATCRKPIVIGGDPETGDPLRLTLWDEDEGGKVVLIAAKKGSGKTVLLSCITERVTACIDAQLLQINLSKVREDRRWSPLAAASALGRDEIGKARRILQWVYDVIDARSKGGEDARVQPTPETPLLVVKIDEVDVVAADEVCRMLLQRIASKCRSEGVCLIIAGQRATAQWMGGADLRANVDVVVLGRFARAAESRHATGAEAEMPDMGAYGEGHPGVFLVTELGGGGGYDRGRVFNLSAIPDIERIVTERAAARRPYVLEPALAGVAGAWAKITGDEPDEGAPYGGSTDAYDEDLDEDEEPPAYGGGYDAGGLAAKVAAARTAAAAGPDIPPIPPGMEAHAAGQLAERQRQFREQYTDIALPEADQAALRAMLARPGGITTRAAAAAVPWSHTRVHQQFVRWRQEGTAELRGKGSGRRWHASAPGAVPVSWPPLRALPDPAEPRAEGDLP